MNRRPFVLVTLTAGTALTYALGYAIGVPVLLPFLNAMPAVPLMYLSIRQGRTHEAIARMLLWAAVMGICATVLSWRWTDESGRLFLNGDAYRREMFDWIRTGVGAESTPRLFLPNHAKHAALFCALSLVSGSVLSMPMGAALMNYMGHYVGALVAVSEHPLSAALLAWNPWSLVRITSFVTLGVVLAGPMMARVGGFSFSLRAHRRLMLLALSGLLLDVIVKTLLAPSWQSMLKRAAGW